MKAEKGARQKEAIRIANMNEEEMMAEETKKVETKLDKVVEERNDAAVQNVEAQRDLKVQLVNKGATPVEIKKAIKSLKRSQREEQQSLESSPASLENLINISAAGSILKIAFTPTIYLLVAPSATRFKPASSFGVSLSLNGDQYC